MHRPRPRSLLVLAALFPAAVAVSNGWWIWTHRHLGGYDPDEMSYLSAALRIPIINDPILDPVRKAIATVQVHSARILERWTSTHSNARLEGLNGLFQAARARARGYRNVATFAYAYQDRFRALPGDDAGAASHLSGGVKASTGGTAGNGRIEGNWNSTTATDESVLFWQHVRLANLASGDGRNPGLEGLVILDWLPRNAAGGRTGITGVAPITGWAGNFFVCQDNIPGSLARQVDIAMDDGQPAAGSVRLLANGSASGSALPLQ